MLGASHNLAPLNTDKSIIDQGLCPCEVVGLNRRPHDYAFIDELPGRLLHRWEVATLDMRCNPRLLIGRQINNHNSNLSFSLCSRPLSDPPSRLLYV